MSVHLIVVTPERTTFEDDVEGVVVPLIDGEAGILQGHAPMIGRLAPGELRVQQDGTSQQFYIDGGFVQVLDNTVSVLTGRTSALDQIDVAAAQKVLEKTIPSANDKPEIRDLKNKMLAQARAQLRLANRN